MIMLTNSKRAHVCMLCVNLRLICKPVTKHNQIVVISTYSAVVLLQKRLLHLRDNPKQQRIYY